MSVNHHSSRDNRDRDWNRAPSPPRALNSPQRSYTTRDYHRLIARYANEKDAAGALAVLDEMSSKNVSIPLVVYNTAMAACVKHWQIAVELLGTLEARSVSPDTTTYLRTIQACEKTHWQMAIGLIQRAKRQQQNQGSEILNVAVYDVALRACKRTLQAKAAESLMIDMKDSGLEPGLESYLHTLGAFKRSFDWERALGLFLELKAKQLRPDQKTYAAIIRAMEPSRQWEIVNGLLAEIESNGLLVDKSIWDSAIAVLHAGKQWPKALDLYETMLKAGDVPALGSYNAAIHGCVRANDWERGIDFFSHMLDNKVMPDSSTCNGVLACCDQGACESQAWKVVKFMRKHELSMGRLTYVHAITSLRNSVNWERAWSLIGEMENKALQPSLELYTSPMKMMSHSMDEAWERVLNLYDRLQLYGLKPNSTCYAFGLHACDAGSRWEMANKLLAEMERNCKKDITVKNHNHAIHACLGAQQWAVAVGLVEAMQLKDVELNLETQTYKIFGLGMMGEWRAAVDLVAQLRSGGNATFDMPFYNALVNTFMRSERFDDAEDTVALMRRKGFDPDPYTYFWLLEGYQQFSKHKQVIRTFDMAQKAGMELDSEGFDALVNAHRNNDDWEAALETYSRMKEEGVRPSSDTYGQILEIHVKLDDPTSALMTLRAMANETSKPKPKAVTSLMIEKRNDHRWQPIIDAFEHITKGNSEDAIRVVKDAGMWSEDEEDDRELHRDLRLDEGAGGRAKIQNPREYRKEGESAHDAATRVMGGTPIQPQISAQTSKSIGLSSDPLLADLQGKKLAIEGIPKNLEMIPMHPDVEVPHKDDPGYIEAVVAAKMRWKNEVRRTCYVGNLAPELTEAELGEFFTSVGRVVCVAPRRNFEQPLGITPATAQFVQPSWFTFVEFDTPRSADLACQLGGYVLGDRPIKIGRANQPIVKEMVPDRELQEARFAEMAGHKNAVKNLLVDDGLPDLEEIDRKLPALLKQAEENAMRAKKETEEDVYKVLEDEVDVTRKTPKTEQERKRERKERRRRSISREKHRKAKALQLEAERLHLTIPPTPAPKKVDPNKDRFFNGWTWIPKDQAKDWIEASQLATVQHLKQPLTPGMATLDGKAPMLPPGILASLEYENEQKASQSPVTAAGQPGFSSGFTGKTGFTAAPQRP